MNPSKSEHKKPESNDQTWRLGKMLYVGLTDVPDVIGKKMAVGAGHCFASLGACVVVSKWRS